MWLEKLVIPSQCHQYYQHQYASQTCLFQLSLAANQATSKLRDLKKSFYLLMILKIWTVFSWWFFLQSYWWSLMWEWKWKKQYLSIVYENSFVYHLEGLRDHLPKGPWNPLWEPLGNLFLVLHFRLDYGLSGTQGTRLTLGKLSEVLRVLGELFPIAQTVGRNSSAQPD